MVAEDIEISIDLVALKVVYILGEYFHWFWRRFLNCLFTIGQRVY